MDACRSTPFNDYCSVPFRVSVTAPFNDSCALLHFLAKCFFTLLLVSLVFEVGCSVRCCVM